MLAMTKTGEALSGIVPEGDTGASRLAPHHLPIGCAEERRRSNLTAAIEIASHKNAP